MRRRRNLFLGFLGVGGDRRLRAFLVLLVLLAGIPAPGLCIEADGRLHVASADHLCCDPAPARAAGGGLVLAEGDSMHQCDHASLDPASASLNNARQDRTGLAAPLGEPVRIAVAPAIGLCSAASARSLLPDRTPDLTVLRL